MKAVEYLVQSYVGLLDRFPNSVEVMLSFVYFLREFTSLNNIIRYQVTRLEQIEMPLEQYSSLLKLKYAFEAN